MDAVKFLKEANRLCDTVGDCRECPLRDEELCIDIPSGKAEKTVSTVEQWSKEHPVITNGAKFEEVFGRTYMSLPSFVGEWLEQEYKEPKGEK